MIKDITRQISSVFSHPWSREEFMMCLCRLEFVVKEGSTVWEENDGEKWATIVVKDKAVAYLHTRYPLLFIREDLLDTHLTNTFSHLEAIAFTDRDAELYSIDLIVFERWSCGRSRGGGLKANCLSASDIWWATVT